MGQAVGILGVGSYLPSKIVTNQKLIEGYQICGKDGRLKSPEEIYQVTGIKKRHIANQAENTSDLGKKAGWLAIKRSKVPFQEIDRVIVGTSSPETIFPSTACLIQAKLDLPEGKAYDILAGCTGFIYALEDAVLAIRQGLARYVLVVGAEVLSRTVRWEKGEWWKIFVLFGDGAGAVVVGPCQEGRGFLAFDLHADGRKANLAVSKGLGTREEDINILPEMFLNGPEVLKEAIKVMDESTKKVLDQAGLTFEEVKYCLLHQANDRITMGVAREKGLLPQGVAPFKFDKMPEQFYSNIAMVGNTSTASIPIALDELVEKGKISEGDLLVFSAVGSGLTWGSCLLRW